ncbi:hypothetical protein Hanom_Chr09g00803151 [Helianthus anomalus]
MVSTSLSVVVDLDEDEISVFHVDHLDEDLGDGEVFDIAILEVTSLGISVVDISSDSDADSRVSVTSSALRVVGLEAYPTDDTSSAAPVTSTPAPQPTPTSAPTSTPLHTPVHTTDEETSQPLVSIGPTS